MSAPKANGGNGRDGKGRFAPGNKGGPGNPNTQRVARLRETLLNAVTPEEMERVVRALLDKAQEGDVPAIKELLDRTIGKAVAKDDDGNDLPGITVIIREATKPDADD